MEASNGGNGLNINPLLLGSKHRLRWTAELHQRFLDAVMHLGGPDRATPKGVQRVMGIQGLTIYHVKSHLQKYRLALCLPDSSSDGKNADNKETEDDLLSNFNGSSEMQTEALKLQMEVQNRLNEQLEVKRQLQLRMEAQKKYLKKIRLEQKWIGGVEECGAAENLHLDGSSSSSLEPSTPDLLSNVGERSGKKARVSMGSAYSEPEMVLTDQIPELSLNSFPRHTLLSPDWGPL